jgi:hypothetical protein
VIDAGVLHGPGDERQCHHDGKDEHRDARNLSRAAEKKVFQMEAEFIETGPRGSCRSHTDPDHATWHRPIFVTGERTFSARTLRRPELKWS